MSDEKIDHWITMQLTHCGPNAIERKVALHIKSLQAENERLKAERDRQVMLSDIVDSLP
jgi:uncharacterized small protein (DUF1192 family)